MYLVDGTASGLITAEIMNWTGHAVLGPRSKLNELQARDEAQRTGVYLLYGPDPKSGRETLYVGEGDDVGKRIRQHANDPEKDFFERVCLLTSKDQNLTKAHVRYLESRLIALASSAGRVALNNATQPDPVRLPEADVSDMKFFIDQVRLILPALGLDFLRTLNSSVEQDDPPKGSPPRFVLTSKKRKVHATMQEIDGEFVLLAGSKIRTDWDHDPSNNSTYALLHRELKESKKLRVLPDGNYELETDVPFRSPSAAAAVVLGRVANGRTQWRISDTNQTLGEWQNNELELQNNAAEER